MSMGMPKGLLSPMDSSVKIVLDNYSDNVCHPGQTLSGRVECFFNKEKKIRAIRLKFKGRARTKWTTKVGNNNNKYWGEEIYFSQEYSLVTGSIGGCDFLIGAGRHTYPFSYILPLALPSSFEGKYGTVKYRIKATVDRRWKFDYQQKVMINVRSPLDLNRLPGLKNPYAVTVDKIVNNGCYGSDPLTFKISLPATGYAAGQEMNIGAFIENMSNVSVESVQFSIIQVIEFIVDHPSKCHRSKEFTVARCEAGAVGAHAEKAWTSSLRIPAIKFPNLIACSIMNATYRVEAKVILPFPHTNLKTSFPIMIGSVALSGINMGRVGPPPTDSYPSTSAATASLVESFSGFEDASYLPDANMNAPTADVAD